MKAKPRLLLTMGDVAGIGPEILARAWKDLQELCRPVVVGDPGWMGRALELVKGQAEIRLVHRPDQLEASPGLVPCLPGSGENLKDVVSGRVTPLAGKAAYDFLCLAIDLAMAGQADGIVTAPLHKEGLHAAGIPHPGHTEILAERSKTLRFGMVLYARTSTLPQGLGVIHATLHMGLREIFPHLTQENIGEKIDLLEGLLSRLHEKKARLGVAGLNPHAGDGGIFGDEERRIIQPAVQRARKEGINVTGPWPSDSLFVRAKDGEFDGIVAMYHDQGHIPLKLLAGRKAINISVGLPVVRTSVAHGTAYDIAGKGVADPSSLIEAVRMAAKLVESRRQGAQSGRCS